MADERDQSMEDILASIKRVMEEEPVPAPRAARSRRAPADEVLDLSDVVEEGDGLVSSKAAGASRARLAELAAATAQVSDAPLEAVVRDMLRPMLKDWLDRHLPEIVEEQVKREIQRISGKPV